MKTIKGKTNDEAERITQLLQDSGVTDERIAMMDSVITNVAWMRIKLDETRKAIANMSVAIPYDNGGGQTVERYTISGVSFKKKSSLALIEQLLQLNHKTPDTLISSFHDLS